MPYYIKKKTNKEGKRSKPNLVAKLDRVFALYIRLRDVMPNGYGVCISCGRLKPFSELQCGHYYSRKNMSVRFDEMNCNAECAACNCFSADHLIGYRERLIKKIGVSKFDYLTAKANGTKKWDDFELDALINYYKREVKRISTDKGIKVSI